MSNKPFSPPKEDRQYLNPAAAVPKYFHFATVICEHYCNSPIGTLLPTLADLAKRFSVSKETINRSMRYLADRGYVLSERGKGTRIIKELSEALGLPAKSPPEPQPLPAVSAPRPSTAFSGTHTMIGVVFENRGNEERLRHNVAEVEIIGGLQHRLMQEGVYLTTLVLNHQSDDFSLESQLAANPGISGLVFLTDVLRQADAQQCAEWRIPTVAINDERFSNLLTCIVADEVDGVIAMIRHLYSQGHQHITYLLWNECDSRLPRYKGFEAALRNPRLNGLTGNTFTIPLLEEGISILDMATAATEEILEKHPKTTAFIAGSSEVAIGFCAGLRQLGITPGERISVAGFGIGIHELNSVAEGHDHLTTVCKPRYEMGCYAADILITQLKEKFVQTGVVRVPTKIISGTTTGPAR